MSEPWSVRSAPLGCALLVLLAACSNDVDSLCFEGDACALPVLPFKPDAERVEDCEACAVENCTAERDACLAEPECAALLACRGKCSDPGCISSCGERAFYDPLGERPDGLGVFGPYLTCVSQTHCSSDCGWGTNWQCLEGAGYEWPKPPDPTDIPVQIEVVDSVLGLGVAANISICSNPESCTDADWRTNDWGQAEVNFGNRNLLSGGFHGNIHIEAGVARYISHFQPVTRPTRLVISTAFWPPDSTDPQLASVMLVALDCLGAPAPGIRFELEADPEPGPSYYYVADLASFDGTETALPVPSGGFIDVPEGVVTVRALRVDTGEVVASRRDVMGLADWQTRVVLAPNTGGE